MVVAFGEAKDTRRTCEVWYIYYSFKFFEYKLIEDLPNCMTRFSDRVQEQF